MSSLKMGHTYDLKYNNWHVDPFPHLFILNSDGQYTNGFNFHYLPMIRRSMSERVKGGFRKIPAKAWPGFYDKLQKQGYYQRFFDIIDQVTERDLNRSEWRRFVQIMNNKFPAVMTTYRTYHTNGLMITKYWGEGIH